VSLPRRALVELNGRWQGQTARANKLSAAKVRPHRLTSSLIHVVAKEEILKNRKNENLKIMEDYLGG
jgi:hypothetical protein